MKRNLKGDVEGVALTAFQLEGSVAVSRYFALVGLIEVVGLYEEIFAPVWNTNTEPALPARWGIDLNRALTVFRELTALSDGHRT